MIEMIALLLPLLSMQCSCSLCSMQDKHDETCKKKANKKTACTKSVMTSSALRKTEAGREPNVPDDITWRLKLVVVLFSRALDLKRQTVTSEKGPSIRRFAVSRFMWDRWDR